MQLKFRKRFSRGDDGRILWIGLALIFLAGCTVGPEYRKPPVAVPDQWSQALPEDTGPAPEAVDLKRWWTVFKDPMLDSLIARDVENNQDLRLADARIREARAQRSVVAADIQPSVDTSAIYTRSRRSESSPSLAGLGSAGAAFLSCHCLAGPKNRRILQRFSRICADDPREDRPAS